MSFERGSVSLIEFADLGEKRALVVSPDFLNRALANVIVARVTAVERERALPTFVSQRLLAVEDALRVALDLTS